MGYGGDCDRGGGESLQFGFGSIVGVAGLSFDEELLSDPAGELEGLGISWGTTSLVFWSVRAKIVLLDLQADRKCNTRTC